ncbi:MAG: 50S ribosomal protein L4 [Candidatus Roizmanbacteria bacterium]|nr:50S ribosomal protein L4 [Candidatus Roizmanbacteria bacterium]
MEATKKIKAKKEVKEVIVKKYAVDGTDSGVVTLKDELLSFVPNQTLLAQYVRVYLANQREGNASAKTRAEVAGTTKKVYKQKGTGGARHGSKKAPIYKGGGVVGGPKPAEYRLELSKKQRQGTLLSAVALRIQQGSVAVVESDIVKLPPKTKTITTLLKKIEKNNTNILFVLPDSKALGLIKSVRNIEGVSVTHMGALNAHELLNAKNILVVADAFETMQQMFTK